MKKIIKQGICIAYICTIGFIVYAIKGEDWMTDHLQKLEKWANK